MIIEAIYNTLQGIVFGILDFIPVLSISDEFVLNYQGFIELMIAVDQFMPINTFLACCTWMVLIYNLNVILMIVNWLLRRIPGQG